MIIKFLLMLIILITHLNLLLFGLRIPMGVKQLRFDHLRQCPNTDNLTMTFRDLVLTQSPDNMVELNGKLILKDSIGDKPFAMAIELNKCVTKADIATCEYYATIRINDLCDKVDMMGFILDYSNLPKKCPISPGEYIFNHTRGDLKHLGFLPIFDSYWRAKTTLIIGRNNYLACLLCDFSVQYTTRMVKV